MQYKYFYTKRTAAKIRSFYRNVAKKYQHTYSYEDMERNVRDAFFAIYAIERTLPRRRPTISRWAGFYMASRATPLQWSMPATRRTCTTNPLTPPKKIIRRDIRWDASALCIRLSQVSSSHRRGDNRK